MKNTSTLVDTICGTEGKELTFQVDFNGYSETTPRKLTYYSCSEKKQGTLNNIEFTLSKALNRLNWRIQTAIVTIWILQLRLDSALDKVYTIIIVTAI